MKRIAIKVVLTILISFTFSFKVNAECSYQERKALLTNAKNVDISVEPVDNGNDNYSFKFNIVGLTEDVFIKYYNTNNGEENYIFYHNLDSNNIYSFIDNNTYYVYSYNFILYSNNDNCNGYEITSKKVKKPMYNIYSKNINCTYENNKNFKYCKKFTDTDYKLTNDKFYTALNSFNSKKNNETNTNEEKNHITSFFKKYYVLIILSILLVTGFIILMIYINNKRKRL